jgi:hypothetical protein
MTAEHHPREDQPDLSKEELSDLTSDIVDMAQRLENLASRLQIVARLAPTKVVVVDRNRETRRD